MILQEGRFVRTFSNAAGRWAAFGPYYAMFPLDFAFHVIHEFSKPNQWILDPFAGRASSVYAAAVQNRFGIGIEINPVGWLYAQAKINPAPLDLVEKRLEEVLKSAEEYRDQATELPEFFHHCYSTEVLAFLKAARSILCWESNIVDSTLMAFILVYLHGKVGEGLSNQMRMTKAMGPNYSVNWWKERNLTPPKIDVKPFLLKRIRWRYMKGTPQIRSTHVFLGDNTEILPELKNKVILGEQERFSLLFTSPPYYGVTNYHKDQWLRLWMLGGENEPAWSCEKYKGRFESQERYVKLLDTVFHNVSKVMAQNSTIYVRTDWREFTYRTTLDVLRKYFSSWDERIVSRPINQRTQTSLFGNRPKKSEEFDIIFSR